MSKSDYRSFFANVKPFIKLNYFCKVCGVHPVNLSRFMKGSEWDYEISDEKLQDLYLSICNCLEKIA